MTNGDGCRYLAIRCLALVGLLFASAFPAQGQTRLDQFYESHWFAHDGGPANVTAIAQTTDGYLWLSSDRGLVRFDGVAFQPFSSFAAPGEAIQSPGISLLQADDDGGLWVGYAYGGISHLVRGHFQHYGKAEGLPVSTTVAILRDTMRRLWVSTSNAVYLLQGEHFQKLPPSWNLASNDSYRLAEDGAGAIWNTNSLGVFRLAPGSHRFESVPEPLANAETATELARDPSGRMWAIPRSGKRAMVGPLPLPGEDVALNVKRWREISPVNGGIFRRDGTFWFISDDGTHLIDAASSDSGAVQTSTSANAPQAIYVDREGTVWVGASNGLISYRPTKLQPVRFPASVNLQIVPAAPASGVLGNIGTGVLSTIDSGGGVVAAPGVSPHGDVDALHQAPDGSVWVAGKWGVERRRGAEVLEIDLPTWPNAPYEGVTAFATDDANEPWISLAGVGVFQHSQGKWTRYGVHVKLPHELVYNMATDPRGRLWLTYPGGRILRLDHAESSQLVSVEGLRVGGTPVIGFAGRRTWIAGSSGIALIDDSGTHNLAGHLFSGQPMGAIEDNEGDLWILTQAEVIHVPKTEVEHAIRDASHVAAAQRLDYLDGLTSPGESMGQLPSVARTSDGRLWFSRQKSLLTIMPSRMVSNPLPPPVAIVAISADGQRQALATTTDLAVGTHAVNIGFTGLSLAIPQRVRFRWQLLGQDARWSEPSDVREATYTNLSPGRYVFHVTAANEDGVWNEKGATIEFRIPPAFWQTGWFRAICSVLIIGLAWAAHRWQLSQAAKRARERFEERMAERTRIARNLHDTLFQSTLGLSMKFQGFAEKLPSDDGLRRAMEEALEVANQVMAEGRESVHELREAPEHEELSKALVRAAKQFETRDGMPVLQAEVIGEPRALTADVGVESFRIGNEALANAYRHAKAATVSIRVAYEVRQLRMEIRDDGCGFVVPTRGSEYTPGHWGLLGMRERAHRLKLDLDIDSVPGKGTVVVLTVPGTRAFDVAARPGRLMHRLREMLLLRRAKR